MSNFIIVIFLVTIIVILSAFTDKIKLPYPILLVAAGLIIGFVPFLPNLKLDPEIIFLVFLPPLLYDAAFKTSWIEFKKEIRTISALAISLVFFTTVLVAVAAHYLIPGFTWPVSFVLGAIISPPDAVAASSIIKGLGLNKKVITIIEGESLVNDASALIAYRYAVAATLSGSFILWKAGLEFLVIAGGGIAAGFIVGYIIVFAHKKITDNTLVETSLSLLTPFLAYTLAEKFHTSGILAVVTSGLIVSWRSREVFSFQTRLNTTGVWDTVIFLLNGIVFVLIGLQLPELVKDLSSITLNKLIGYGFIISIVTIIIRIIWVFAGAYHQHILKKKKAETDTEEAIDWKNVLIVAWTGTRGVVSLATALALPLTLENGDAFPKRHSILLLAFSVILITLVVQGLTLPLLIRLLKIKPVTAQLQKEEDSLNYLLTKASLQYINKNFPEEIDETAVEKLRKQYEFNYNLLSNRHDNPKNITAKFNSVNQLFLAQLEIIKFKRELLLKFQNEDRFSEESLTKAERELDIEELRINSLIKKTETTAKVATEQKNLENPGS
ncbi:MAG TPA: Na+/H+ antiporter [Parafilimonas sp.]|nr:Na+/H+ antiporter [Parafilimonas sp.]